MRRFFTAMMTWLDRLRRILVNGLFLLFIMLFIVAISIDRAQVPESAVLLVNPKGAIVEELELPGPGMLPLQSALEPVQQTSLHELVRAIRLAAGDERIRMMVLKLDEMGGTSLPKLQAIRGAIETFKQSGKMVVAVGPNYSQSQYYLAAAADRVFIDPLGIVAMEGFSIYRNYFKDALARLDVEVELFRAGEYKAAAEPLVRNDMSKEDREANRELLQQLWNSYKQDIAVMRNIKAERIQQVLDHPSRYLAEHHGSLAELAKEEGLADQLATAGEVKAYIAGAMGVTEDDYPAIDFRGYLAASEPGIQDEGPNRIGIISATGMILDGSQPAGTIGSDSMLEMLTEARQDLSIKAVVLRVDSPGGSAAASERIHSEIVRLQQAGKPVVASFGSSAASGGYMIAASADEIWAAPTTITGSIGAFGVLANVGKGLKRLGIHTDGLGTTSIAGGLRADRSMPDELKRVLQLSVEHVYDRFLKLVSDGRGIEREKLMPLAEGRVWTGLDAKRLGLVDSLGDFDDAIAAAARRAGLEQYSTVWVTPPQTLREFLISKLLGGTQTLLPTLFDTNLVGGVSLSPWLQDMSQTVRLLSSSARTPALLTACELRVVP